MSEREFRILAQELFEHVITLAGISMDNTKRAEELNDQAKHSFEGLVNAYNHSQERVEAIAEELRQKYLPANVTAAIEKVIGVVGTLDRKAQAAATIVETAAKNAKKELDAAKQSMTEELDRQARRHMWLQAVVVGVVCLLAGLFSSPFLARALPFELDTHIAALVMNGERWEAGKKMMMAGNPNGWHTVVTGARLVQDNRDSLAACQGAAIKTGKEQKCSVLVSAE